MPIASALPIEGALEVGLGDDVGLSVRVTGSACEIEVARGLDRGARFVIGRGALAVPDAPAILELDDEGATLVPLPGESAELIPERGAARAGAHGPPARRRRRAGRRAHRGGRMSLADRLRRWWRGNVPPSAEPPASDPASASPSSPTRPSSTQPSPPSPAVPRAPSVLEAIASGAPPDERSALDAFEELARTLGEGTAIAHARRALAVAALPGLRVRVARMLDARGDDEAVEALLSRMPEGPEVPEPLLCEAWMRRAEVAERRGDPDVARALYERVLARDVTYPRARERVAQLRAGLASGPRDGGATVMAEGALTRGRYRVVRELGRGGAGTVFLAEDVALGRQVALKVYHRRGRADRERLLHEARVPAELEHPSVVRVLDVDLELFAIAMEATEGSVKDASRGGALAAPRVLAWGLSICDTLAWLHARGVVHRDLKPSNFLLRRGDRVVLTDFGLASRMGTSASAGGEGTAGYMPPEQRRGDPASAAMDVHALGVSLDEMLSWADWSASASPALAHAIAAMRASEPGARPTIAEVRGVLEQVA
jgi:serine/threonine-protein kinase